MSNQDATRTAEQRLYQVYGLKVADFLGLWDACGGKCQICGTQMHSRWVDGEDGDRSTRCNVDHCHESGEVRGLLCTACNTALGKMDDDIDRLRSAISYLEKPAIGFGNPEKETLKQRQLREEENAMRLLGYYKNHDRFHEEGLHRNPRNHVQLIRARIASNDKAFRPPA
jgi:hypothetical protein